MLMKIDNGIMSSRVYDRGSRTSFADEFRNTIHIIKEATLYGSYGFMF